VTWLSNVTKSFNEDISNKPRLIETKTPHKLPTFGLLWFEQLHPHTRNDSILFFYLQSFSVTTTNFQQNGETKIYEPILRRYITLNMLTKISFIRLSVLRRPSFHQLFIIFFVFLSMFLKPFFKRKLKKTQSAQRLCQINVVVLTHFISVQHVTVYTSTMKQIQRK